MSTGADSGLGDSKSGGGEVSNRPSGEPARNLPIETLERGSTAGYSEPRCLVVRSAEQLETMWRKLHRSRSPLPSMPELPFESGVVLAAFMGQKPTGGYAITIESARLRGAEVIVELNRKVPGPGDIVTQALTAPYHLVWLELDDPGTRVRFENCRADVP